MGFGKTLKSPRVVVVYRASVYQQLLERHATRQHAKFFLKSRGQSLESVDRAHVVQDVTLSHVRKAIPKQWRQVMVLRSDLDRFDFEARDLVVAVGQDGLVANLAKYLEGQSVIGINPDEQANDGVLCRHKASVLPNLLDSAHAGNLVTETRSLVQVCTDDGQSLLALNELFVGHKSHQSARYEIEFEGAREVQSSSGLIVCTGTGASGWARSISQQRASSPELPKPCQPSLAFFVREPFPSVTTGTSIDAGQIRQGRSVELTSQMNEGGVIFGDGMESDRIQFHWGMKAKISIAERGLSLAI